MQKLLMLIYAFPGVHTDLSDLTPTEIDSLLDKIEEKERNDLWYFFKENYGVINKQKDISHELAATDHQSIGTT